MAKVIKLLAAASGVLFSVFTALYIFLKYGVFLSLAITFGVFFYHFAMRLIVGGIINALFRNKMNLENPWFRARKFEKKLYIFLRVRAWRKHVPTYAPETFSRELHSWREIAMATCQAEVVHEIIALLSLVPIFFAIPFGEFWVFLITSVLASLFDTVFVILQRYNRPLVLKVMAAEEKRRK